jgi:hypothetical protein
MSLRDIADSAADAHGDGHGQMLSNAPYASFLLCVRQMTAKHPNLFSCRPPSLLPGLAWSWPTSPQ